MPRSTRGTSAGYAFREPRVAQSDIASDNLVFV